jgi:hypothetical protein
MNAWLSSPGLQPPPRHTVLYQNAPAIPCAVEDMNIWNAVSEGCSFVISYESMKALPVRPGFHGRGGYLASWRPIHEGRGAIRIIGNFRRGRSLLRRDAEASSGLHLRPCPNFLVFWGAGSKTFRTFTRTL